MGSVTDLKSFFRILTSMTKKYTNIGSRGQGIYIIKQSWAILGCLVGHYLTSHSKTQSEDIVVADRG